MGLSVPKVLLVTLDPRVTRVTRDSQEPEEQMVPPDRLVAQVLEETRASQDKMEIQVHQDQLDQLDKGEILEAVDSLDN